MSTLAYIYIYIYIYHNYSILNFILNKQTEGQGGTFCIDVNDKSCTIVIEYSDGNDDSSILEVYCDDIIIDECALRKFEFGLIQM
jgi:hypothetical protein